ncbi:MAG TPA: 4-hydroxy-3-methylbut-2-en-1-yl diphosphate synthase, partial [Acidimicrobiales bacterium]|nr:4-hydroxy-3-methylbut-2-en-1-yl diphosphate synthase [Acidimicrobiales bacterium]
KGHLFIRGQNVAVVPESEMVEALVDWATYIDEHGIDAALERARATSDTARRAAERDRAELLGEQGADANRSEQRVEVIRKLG